jgi:hypothetical protein
MGSELLETAEGRRRPQLTATATSTSTALNADAADLKGKTAGYGKGNRKGFGNGSY